MDGRNHGQILMLKVSFWLSVMFFYTTLYSPTLFFILNLSINHIISPLSLHSDGVTPFLATTQHSTPARMIGASSEHSLCVHSHATFPRPLFSTRHPPRPFLRPLLIHLPIPVIDDLFQVLYSNHIVLFSHPRRFIPGPSYLLKSLAFSPSATFNPPCL